MLFDQYVQFVSTFYNLNNLPGHIEFLTQSSSLQ